MILREMSASNRRAVTWHGMHLICHHSIYLVSENPFPTQIPTTDQAWTVPAGSPVQVVDKSTVTQTANLPISEIFFARLQDPFNAKQKDSYVEWRFSAPQGHAAVGVVKGPISILEGPLNEGDSCFYSNSGKIFGGRPSIYNNLPTAFSIDGNTFGAAWKGNETFGMGINSGKLVFTR